VPFNLLKCWTICSSTANSVGELPIRNVRHKDASGKAGYNAINTPVPHQQNNLSQSSLFHPGSKNMESLWPLPAIIWYGIKPVTMQLWLNWLLVHITLSLSSSRRNLRIASEYSCSVIRNHADLKYAQDLPFSSTPLGATWRTLSDVGKMIKAASTVSYELPL
jgi:hypothetical protein